MLPQEKEQMQAVAPVLFVTVRRKIADVRLMRDGRNWQEPALCVTRVSPFAPVARTC